MHRNVRGLATNVEHTVVIIINQRGNSLLHFLPISSSVCIKLTMNTLVICGNLLKINSGFVFVRFVSLKSDINLKLNDGLDKL